LFLGALFGSSKVSPSPLSGSPGVLAAFIDIQGSQLDVTASSLYPGGEDDDPFGLSYCGPLCEFPVARTQIVDDACCRISSLVAKSNIRTPMSTPSVGRGLLGRHV